MAIGKADIPGSLLETTLNTRDLGGYMSGISGKRLKKWSLLRSDVPNRPSCRDLELLKSKSICTVIDMRGENDVQKKPSGFSGREGFSYLHIPIDEGSGVPKSTDAVSESYMDIAESKNIASVFRIIATAPGGVMFNCTAGKDRTGVVSAILLGVCGVSDGDIVADYMITKTRNRERFEQIHRNFPDIDMNIVIPHERYMAEFLAKIKSKYGGFREYLTSVGLTQEEIDGLTAKLL